MYLLTLVLILLSLLKHIDFSVNMTRPPSRPSLVVTAMTYTTMYSSVIPLIFYSSKHRTITRKMRARSVAKPADQWKAPKKGSRGKTSPWHEKRLKMCSTYSANIGHSLRNTNLRSFIASNRVGIRSLLNLLSISSWTSKSSQRHIKSLPFMKVPWENSHRVLEFSHTEVTGVI